MNIIIRWMDIEQNNMPIIPLLSDYREEKLNKQGAAMRKRSLASEYLLRRCLEEMGITPDGKLNITTNENGKPYLNDIPVFFNVSHSGNIVACALSDCDIGLDVQKRSPYNPALADKYFSKAELSCIERSDDKEGAYTLLWASKESYIKAMGSTLAQELKNAVIDLEPGEIISCRGYKIYSLTVGDYIICCCPLTGDNCSIDIKETTL